MTKTPIDIFDSLESFESIYTGLSDLEDPIDMEEFLKDIPTESDILNDLRGT